MRPVIRIVLYFLLSLAVCLGGLFVYAGWYIQSSNFPELIERNLTEATGFNWHINGDLHLSIVPLAIKVSDVQVVDPETEKAFLTVGGVQSRVDIPTLLGGKVFINYLRLQDLDVTLSDQLLKQKDTKPDVANVDIEFSLGKMAGGFDLQGIDIQRGRIVWEHETDSGKKFVAATGVNLQIDFDKKTLFDLSCDIEGTVVPAHGHLQLMGESDFNSEKLTAEEVHGSVDWKGDVELEGRNVPTAISVVCSLNWPERELRFSEVKAEVAKGKLTFDGTMTDISNSDWKLAGQAIVQDFSLPYWFGFTENLPTSLNHALDSIDGVIAIEMTKDHVWSDSLKAEVLGMPLEGVGGVKDFSNPVVFIDVAGEDIDVNRIFPEISMTPPDVLPKPSDDAPPIFRYTDDEPVQEAKAPAKAGDEATDEATDELSVGYDIRVGAKRATAYGFAINDLAFRCWPAPNLDTLTSYKIGKAYGGSVDSVMTIADDLRLQATITNVETTEISRILTGDSVITGIANGTADVRAKAHTVFGLVAGLGGKINAVFKNGYVKSLATKQPDGTLASSQNFFDELKIDLSGKSLMKEPDKAGNDLLYNWDLSVLFDKKDSDDSYLTKIKGPIVISAKRVLPVRGENIDLDMTWKGTMNVNTKAVPLTAHLVSKCTYNMETEDLSIRDGLFTFDSQSFKVQGDGKQFISAPEIKGSFVGDEFDLHPLLTSLNLLRWQPRDNTAFSRASLRGEFDLRKGRYALYNVVGYVDDSALKGSVLVNLNGAVPTVRADAELGDIMLTRYFPPEDVDVRAKIFNKKPWKLEWLKEVDVKGSLKIASVRLDPVDAQELVTPIVIGGGEIQVGPLEAKLYNGTFSGEFKGVLKDKLESRLVANVNGVDLALASKGAAGDDYLGGLGTGYIEATGQLASSYDILASLDGIWGISVKDGFFGFSKNKKGEVEKTTFASAISDGDIKQGIMSSDNTAVTSPFVDMRGGGKIDLPDRKIDYKVNVTYARIPTVPVTIVGSWDDPKVTVDGLSVVPRTFGKIGGGVFSILKDAVLIPFRAVDLLPSLR
ncbi:AsmA-like C-terminal region-containing protein [Halodesulfovibrio aestuarii]|uniref:AsmA family protein n=1 Tax=Halodesulfovibrio aestuarii TaxID=126333 RepID=UPI00352160FA